MNLRYEKLFSIEMLHEYYANQQCCDFDIIPSPSSAAVAKNLSLQWRQVDNRLVALMRVNDHGEPFMNVPPAKSFQKYYSGTVFRFYLRLKNPVFINYTNLDTQATDRNKIFYFSNLSTNTRAGRTYLSQPILEYALNKTYLPGDLILDPAANTILEAVKKQVLKKKTSLNDRTLWAEKGLAQTHKVHEYAPKKTYAAGELVTKPATELIFESRFKQTSGDVADLDNNNLWVPRENGTTSYPTANDLTDFTTADYNFHLSKPSDKVAIEIFTLNQKSNQYDLPATAREDRKLIDKTSTVKIALSALPPGKYRITVNGDSRFIYLDPTVNTANTFAVIEIFTHLAGADHFALFTDEEKLKSPVFSLYFANRKVLWKYVRKDSKAESITDTGDTKYHFELIGDNFVSTAPIGLSETACKTLKLDFNSRDFRMFPLPNPRVNNLGRFHLHDFDYLCSEIFLNY